MRDMPQAPLDVAGSAKHSPAVPKLHSSTRPPSSAESGQCQPGSQQPLPRVLAWGLGMCLWVWSLGLESGLEAWVWHPGIERLRP